jgi:hypothetical protein
LQHFEPIHVRHRNVEQDDLRLQSFDTSKSLSAITGFAYDVDRFDHFDQGTNPARTSA